MGSARACVQNLTSALQSEIRSPQATASGSMISGRSVVRREISAFFLQREAKFSEGKSERPEMTSQGTAFRPAAAGLRRTR
jgi:hypothetical protein